MTVDQKLKAIGAVVLLFVVAFFVTAYVREREARIRAEDQVAATKQVMDSTNAAIASRDQLAAANAQKLEEESSAITTPQQAAQVIVRYLPTPPTAPGAPAAAPVPLQTIQAGDLTAQGQKDLPDAPTDVILTAAEAESQAKEDLACQASTVDLTACTADKVDQKTQIAALEKQSDAWEAAAKGGTKVQRFLKVMKFVGCAAAGAYAGTKIDKAGPGTGAAVGGASGVAACSLF
jgi:hypothetical protein